eukprot:6470196-Amphidinium_carterae.1
MPRAKQRAAPVGWRFTLGRHGWARAVEAITVEGRPEPFEHLMDAAVAASRISAHASNFQQLLQRQLELRNQRVEDRSVE